MQAHHCLLFLYGEEEQVWRVSLNICRISLLNQRITRRKEIINASNIKMQALNMKMEMVSGANLIEEGIDLVERYRGYTGQKKADKHEYCTYSFAGGIGCQCSCYSWNRR